MDTHFYFYLISGIALAMSISFSFITKNIQYHTPDTDNELMAYAAAQSGKWRWPSDIHKYGIAKTFMKDTAIILLALFQRIMGDKESDHPYVTMTGFAVSVSAVLIYLIGANYWNPAVGLFISLLYIFSFWPWQIALYGGHVNIATTFFLASIYLIQKSAFCSPTNIYLALSGASLCCAMFSSASSMKFLIPFWGEVFYSRYYSLINRYDYAGLYSSLPLHSLWKYDLAVIAVILIAVAIIFSIYKKIVNDMYYTKGPSFLHGMIRSQDKFSLEHYIHHANRKLKKYLKVFLWIVGIMAVILNTVNIHYSWPVFAGFILMFLIFTLPNVNRSVYNYFLYIFEPLRKTHFRAYIDNFAKRGITVFRNTRGAGWPWVPRLFWRITPIYMVLFLLTLFSILALHISTGRLNILPADLAVLLIATAPIWWGEFTKAPQGSRSYSPALTTSLLFVGYSFSIFYGSSYLSSVAVLALISVLVWNLWKFTTDVYPSRMGTANLIKILNKLNIKEFYTCETRYNRSFVEAIHGIGESEYTLRRKIDPPFVVRRINSISEVRDGWIVIPSTSSKTVISHLEPEAINDGDYTKDPVLNKLIETREIEKIAIAKIKTYGNSRIWSLEDEVLGYRDLILHDIGPEDLYRGYAWIFHSNKLKN